MTADPTYLLMMAEAVKQEQPGSTVWSRAKTLLELNGWAQKAPGSQPPKDRLCLGEAIAQAATGDPSNIYLDARSSYPDNKMHPLYLLLGRVAQITGATEIWPDDTRDTQVWRWNDATGRTLGQVVMVLVTLHTEALALVYRTPLDFSKAKEDPHADV